MADYSEKFKNHMSRNDCPPPVDIKADGVCHRYPLENHPSSFSEALYVVSFDKTAVGFYGFCGSSDRHRWAIKRSNDSELAAFKIKVKMMKSQFEAAQSVARSDVVKKAHEQVPEPLIEMDPTGRIEIDDEAIVERLSKLTPFAFERVRSNWAAYMGVRPCVLEKAVEQARKRRPTATFKSKSDHVKAQQQVLDLGDMPCSPE